MVTQAPHKFFGCLHNMLLDLAESPSCIYSHAYAYARARARTRDATAEDHAPFQGAQLPQHTASG